MRIFLVLVCFLSSTAFGDVLDQTKVDQIVEPFLKKNKFVGVAVAVVSPNKEVLSFYGETQKGNGTKPDGRSVFEIASITKALTGTLVAGYVLDKKIDLKAQASQYLPDQTLSKSNAPITVEQLVTHRSGIKAIVDPAAFKIVDPLNPWQGFGKRELFHALPLMDLNFAPGTKHEYSNLATGIVGYILEAVDGRSYEKILKDKISIPLQLENTVITLSDDQKQKLVSGYYLDEQGKLTPITKWDMSGLPAAGAVCSTLEDMVVLSKGLSDKTTPLGQAFVFATQKRAETEIPNNFVGVFWNVMDGFAWHNGATFGQSSFMAIHPEKKVSVIVLTNTFTPNMEATLMGLQLMQMATK